MDDDFADRAVAHIAEQGYVVLPDAIDLEMIDALQDDLLGLERDHGITPSDNSFEGAHTVRIYNLLARGGLYHRVPVHGAVLPVVEAVLDPGCLVSSLSSISIGPGEDAQPIHADDQLIPLPKPHPPTVCNTMWALTEFTEDNGATRLVPGSHLWDHSPEYGSHHESVPAEMTKGSVLIWHGSLWHGGGANRTGQRRSGIAMNYCAGWIRQQENQQLGIPPEVLAGLEPRLAELVGLGIYKGLMGHIEKRSPARALFGSADSGLLWDGA